GQVGCLSSDDKSAQCLLLSGSFNFVTNCSSSTHSSMFRVKISISEMWKRMQEFPNLDQNYTCMAKVLTLDMYTRQFNRATESGVIFDDIIRPGLEDPAPLHTH
ncbi:hypothetical protein JZ751_027606, partial [Albula glossodonta]